MKKILVLLLALAMLFAFAGCSGNDDFEPDLSDLPTVEGANFKEMIDDFAEDSFNVINLKSGKKEKVFKADYVLSSGCKCYSSDESVATISDSGTVTARGKGTCYVLLVSNDGAFGRKTEIYKIVVDAPLSMTVNNFFDSIPNGMGDVMRVVLLIFGLLFAGGIVVIIVIVIKVANANKSAAPGFGVSDMGTQQPGFTMPHVEQPNGVNNVNPGAAAGRVCPNCGQKAEGAFCPYCGTKLN